MLTEESKRSAGYPTVGNATGGKASKRAARKRGDSIKLRKIIDTSRKVDSRKTSTFSNASKAKSPKANAKIKPSQTV